MTKAQSNSILIAVLAVVIILSVIGYYSQKNKNNNIGKRVYSELLQEYTSLLQNKEFDKAYNNFTSEDYKRKYTLAAFIHAQDSNHTAYGKLQSIMPATGIFFKEMGDSKFIVYKGTVRYKAEKSERLIVVEICFENGKMKLNRTYDSYVTLGNVLPVIY